MKLSRIIALLAIPALLTLAACSDDPASASGDKKANLTAKPWRTVSMKLNGADVTAISQQLTDFNEDGSYVATNPDGSTEPGTWEFNVDQTSLVMDKGTDEEASWNILVLTSSSLKLRASVEFGGATLITEYEGVPQ